MNKYNTTIKLLGILTATLLLIPITAQTPLQQATAQQNPVNVGIEDGPLTLDKIFLDIEKKLPGFSGAFLDDTGKLNVYLKEPTRLDQAQVANVLTEHLGSEYLENGLVILKGEHEWNKWYTWKKMVRTLFDQEELGITMLDIDEKEQTLAIGLEALNEVNKAKVTTALAKFPIPSDTVQFFEVSPIVFESHETSVTFRPLRGGILEGYSFQEACTIGFVADNQNMNNKRVMISAGHCEVTKDLAGDEKYYQPRQVDQGPQVGIEIVNTNLPGPRFSDTLQWEPSVSTQRGKIYRDSFTEFTISGKGYTQLVGEFVCKNGYVTHETCSTIKFVGVDAPRSDPYYTTLYSQNRTTYTSSGGDSGGPVYKKGSYPFVILYGTHVGTATKDGVTYKIYSPIRNIEWDQGTLTVTP